MKIKFKNIEKGQALVMLLFLMIVAVTVTTSAVIVLITGSLSTTNFQKGTETSFAAESGAENALLSLLRNPSYKGETLIVGSANVSTVVSAGTPQIITSIATSGGVTRQIQVSVSNNKIATISSWKEVF